MKLNIKKTMAIVITIAIVGYAAYIYFNEPGSGSIHFVCPSKSLLHLNCAGCGMTRFVYSAMHGDIKTALDYNILGFPILATVAFVYFYFLRWSFFDVPFPQIPMWVAYVYLTIVVGYSVARNIPFEPFTYLAP